MSGIVRTNFVLKKSPNKLRLNLCQALVQVEYEAGVEVGVEIGVEVGVYKFQSQSGWCSNTFSVGGWLEKWELNLTSAKVEVEAGLGKIYFKKNSCRSESNEQQLSQKKHQLLQKKTPALVEKTPALVEVNQDGNGMLLPQQLCLKSISWI